MISSKIGDGSFYEQDIVVSTKSQAYQKPLDYIYHTNNALSMVLDAKRAH